MSALIRPNLSSKQHTLPRSAYKQDLLVPITDALARSRLENLELPTSAATCHRRQTPTPSDLVCVRSLSHHAESQERLNADKCDPETLRVRFLAASGPLDDQGYNRCEQDAHLSRSAAQITPSASLAAVNADEQDVYVRLRRRARLQMCLENRDSLRSNRLSEPGQSDHRSGTSPFPSPLESPELVTPTNLDEARDYGFPDRRNDEKTLSSISKHVLANKNAILKAHASLFSRPVLTPSSPSAPVLEDDNDEFDSDDEMKLQCYLSHFSVSTSSVHEDNFSLDDQVRNPSTCTDTSTGTEEDAINLNRLACTYERQTTSFDMVSLDNAPEGNETIVTVTDIVVIKERAKVDMQRKKEAAVAKRETWKRELMDSQRASRNHVWPLVAKVESDTLQTTMPVVVKRRTDTSSGWHRKQKTGMPKLPVVPSRVASIGLCNAEELEYDPDEDLLSLEGFIRGVEWDGSASFAVAEPGLAKQQCIEGFPSKHQRENRQGPLDHLEGQEKARARLFSTRKRIVPRL